MNNQPPGDRRQHFFTIVKSHGVGLAYFLGSQKKLENSAKNRLTRNEAPETDNPCTGGAAT